MHYQGIWKLTSRRTRRRRRVWLFLGNVTRDINVGLQLAAVAPFGGVGASGTGSRHAGPQANIEAFTEPQWVTLRGDTPAYPF